MEFDDVSKYVALCSWDEIRGTKWEFCNLRIIVWDFGDVEMVVVFSSKRVESFAESNSWVVNGGCICYTLDEPARLVADSKRCSLPLLLSPLLLVPFTTTNLQVVATDSIIKELELMGTNVSIIIVRSFILRRKKETFHPGSQPSERYCSRHSTRVNWKNVMLHLSCATLLDCRNTSDLTISSGIVHSRVATTSLNSLDRFLGN